MITKLKYGTSLVTNTHYKSVKLCALESILCVFVYGNYWQI